MEWERNENQVLLRGIVDEMPSFSHESRGERYQTFPLSVERLSGVLDRLPILCTEALARGVIGAFFSRAPPGGACASGGRTA